MEKRTKIIIIAIIVAFVIVSVVLALIFICKKKKSDEDAKKGHTDVEKFYATNDTDKFTDFIKNYISGEKGIWS